MHDSGCVTEDISRFCGHQAATTKTTNAQTHSYLTNPPVPCLIERAGGDPKNPEYHVAPYTLPAVDENMLREIPQIRGLLDWRDVVHTAYHDCASHQERMKRRLCTAKGSIDSMINDIKRAFQFFASRPLDPETQVLQADKQTIQETERFQQGTLRELFALPVFAGNLYQDLRQRVRASEDHYVGLTLQLDDSVRNELHRFMKECVAQPIRAIQMSMHHMSQEVGRLSSLQHQAPRIPESSQLATASISTTVASHPKRPLTFPPPPSQDTTEGGKKPRTKRRGISQRKVLSAETTGSGCPRPNLLDSDSGCTTLRQYWDVYKTKWKPLKDRWCHEWRVEKAFLHPDDIFTSGYMLRYHMVSHMVSTECLFEKHAIRFDFS